MWMITCPHCRHKADMEDFEPSCADECTCPKCGESFEVDLSVDDDDDDDE